MSYNISSKGYYGSFGGAYIPEMLLHNIEELKENYLKIINDKSFTKEFNELLKNYVGRPSPLYFSKNLCINLDIGYLSKLSTYKPPLIFGASKIFQNLD